jgi:hypothetical protein
LKVGITGHKFGRELSKDHSTKIWLELTQWFLKRRFLCEFPKGFYVKLSSAVGAILVEVWTLPNLCPVIPTFNQDGRQARNRKKGGWSLKKMFSSETNEPISTKLCWNDPWVVPFQNCVRQCRPVGITGHNFGRGPSKDHSTKVWLQLVQLFLRRRFVCEFPIGSYVKLNSAVGAIDMAATAELNLT